jgi:antitoxin FitA
MASALTVRQLDDDVYQKLRERAASHGRSLEAEARAILAAAVHDKLPGSDWFTGLDARAMARTLGKQQIDSTQIIREMRDSRYGDAWLG